MANVEDLVGQIIARDKRAEQTFQQPQQDTFMLDMLEMYVDYQGKKKVANSDALNNIISVIDKVNTPEGMAAISSSLDDLQAKSGDDTALKTNIGLLRGINTKSLANYNTYKQGIDRGLEYVDSDSFPKELSQYQNLEQIAFDQGFVKEDGTGDSRKYLYSEKEKIHSIIDKIGLGYDGEKKKFSYKQGMDTGVTRKLQHHLDQLDIGIQGLAHDGKLSKEEAEHMMIGDTKFYEADKKLALQEASTIIKTGNSRLNTVIGLIERAEEKRLDADDFLTLDKSFDIAGESLSKTEDGYESIRNSLEEYKSMLEINIKASNSKYRDWTGRDYNPTLGFEEGYTEDPDIEETVETGTEEEQIKSGEEEEEVAEGKYAPLSQTKESEGLTEEAALSPVLEKKIANVNSIRNTLNEIKNVGTPANMTQDGITLKSPRTNKTDVEKALELDIGETISIDKLYEYKNTIIPNLRKERSSLKNRQKYLKDLYPTISMRNWPENIKKEFSEISNKLKDLNRKLDASSLMYRTDLNSIINKKIKQYEDFEIKLKQAEKDLDNFKKTYKAK